MSIYPRSQALERLDSLLERVELWRSRYQRNLTDELKGSLNCAHGDLIKIYHAYEKQERATNKEGVRR